MYECSTDAYMQPLGDYVSLRLIRVEESTSTEGHVPFLLSRLVGRHYHVGPEGVTIGAGAECSVCVPPESEAWPRHAQIKWTAGGFYNSHLTLTDELTYCSAT